jgi:hypothetical protein
MSIDERLFYGSRPPVANRKGHQSIPKREAGDTIRRCENNQACAGEILR